MPLKMINTQERNRRVVHSTQSRSFAMLFLLSIIKRITIPTKALHAMLIECPNPSVTNMMKM
jgi:hypothetical protein